MISWQKKKRLQTEENGVHLSLSRLKFVSKHRKDIDPSLISEEWGQPRVMLHALIQITQSATSPVRNIESMAPPPFQAGWGLEIFTPTSSTTATNTSSSSPPHLLKTSVLSVYIWPNILIWGPLTWGTTLQCQGILPHSRKSNVLSKRGKRMWAASLRRLGTASHSTVDCSGEGCSEPKGPQRWKKSDYGTCS